MISRSGQEKWSLNCYYIIHAEIMKLCIRSSAESRKYLQRKKCDRDDLAVKSSSLPSGCLNLFASLLVISKMWWQLFMFVWWFFGRIYDLWTCSGFDRTKHTNVEIKRHFWMKSKLLKKSNTLGIKLLLNKHFNPYCVFYMLDKQF